MPSVLIVNSPGPQGPVGPQGPSGSAGVFPTGSYVTTSSFNAFTGSYNTGSFTGSFTGNGIGLYNIPASGITGLNLSQIASGSVSASISTGTGSFIVTSGSTNLLFVNNSGFVGIGTSNPSDKLEVLGTTTTSFSVHSTGTGNNGRAAFTLARIPTPGSTSETGWQFLKDGNDNFVFRSISAGSAADRMYLYTSGNAGIGTTSTDAGFKLDVNGTGRFSGNLTTTGSLTIQPTSSATQVVAIIQAGSGSLALIPSGSGAIVASIPDGTATGGNARGQYAVDLQTYRTNAFQVAAANFSVIGGGSQNRIATGIVNATIAGGNQNYLTQNYSTIAGGNNNIGSGTFTSIIGGDSNNAGSNYSTISGGQSNTVSTNTHATVVGGSSNTSSGQASVSGGSQSVASGFASTAFGQSCTANQHTATVFGQGSTASGAASFAHGGQAYSYMVASRAFSGGRFTTVGDAQYQEAIARNKLTGSFSSGASTKLQIDATGGTDLNPFIPNGTNRSWHTTVDTVAVVTAISGSATGVTAGDSFMQTDKLLFKKVGGTSSIVGRSTTETIYDTSMSSVSMSYTVGASNDMEVNFTAPTFSGGGSITCRVVSKVSLVEVAY